MRKLTAATAFALLVPCLALAAGGKPASPGKSQAAKVMYVLKGTLTAYTPADGATKGSVGIDVSASNHHGASLNGKTLTFAVSSTTKIVGTVKANDKGMVKLRGPKAGLGDQSTFPALVAFQVIDQSTATDHD